MDDILKKLGFGSFFKSHCKELQIENDSIARVIAEHKSIYYVKNAKGEFQARVTGKQMYTAVMREDYPAVGDWVVVNIIDTDQAIITQILPRKTIIRKSVTSRKSTGRIKNQVIAANVDEAFIVESVDRDYSINRFERYFVLAKDGGVEPHIIINKTDLISKEKLDSIVEELSQRFCDCKIIFTSTSNKNGLDDLKDSVCPGKTYCFLGSSGVGKSSIINALIGEQVIKTGEISLSVGRGKHVTTHREMYFLSSGGIVIDNPGMREVGLTNSEAGVGLTYSDIGDLSLKCRFPDCTHIHEPGCAVLEALELNQIDQEYYDNYIQLKKESEHYDMNDHEKREKDKKFSKFVKNSIKRLKEFE